MTAYLASRTLDFAASSLADLAARLGYEDDASDIGRALRVAPPERRFDALRVALTQVAARAEAPPPPSWRYTPDLRFALWCLRDTRMAATYVDLHEAAHLLIDATTGDT